MQTTYPLKVQAMRSQGKQPRFYVSFPLALAAAIGLEGGETVQWELLDRGELHLVRPVTGWRTAAVLNAYRRAQEELQRRAILSLWDLRCITCPHNDGLCTSSK